MHEKKIGVPPKTSVDAGVKGAGAGKNSFRLLDGGG